MYNHFCLGSLSSGRKPCSMYIPSQLMANSLHEIHRAQDVHGRCTSTEVHLVSKTVHLRAGTHLDSFGFIMFRHKLCATYVKFFKLTSWTPSFVSKQMINMIYKEEKENPSISPNSKKSLFFNILGNSVFTIILKAIIFSILWTRNHESTINFPKVIKSIIIRAGSQIIIQLLRHEDSMFWKSLPR